MSLITNFLLSRGIAKGPEIIAKLVRHGMGALGGYLAAHQLATPDETGTLTAGALVAASILWSVARTFLAKAA